VDELTSTPPIVDATREELDAKVAARDALWDRADKMDTRSLKLVIAFLTGGKDDQFEAALDYVECRKEWRRA
jgi:hypothetical protein